MAPKALHRCTAGERSSCRKAPHVLPFALQWQMHGSTRIDPTCADTHRSHGATSHMAPQRMCLRMQIYTALERHIEQPDFLTKLEAARRRSAASPSSPDKPTDPADGKGEEVLHKDWWEAPASTASLAEAEGFTEVHAPQLVKLIYVQCCVVFADNLYILPCLTPQKLESGTQRTGDCPRSGLHLRRKTTVSVHAVLLLSFAVL